MRHVALVVASHAVVARLGIGEQSRLVDPANFEFVIDGNVFIPNTHVTPIASATVLIRRLHDGRVAEADFMASFMGQHVETTPFVDDIRAAGKRHAD